MDLLSRVQRLTPKHHEQIFHILKQHSVPFTKNANGIFVDLGSLPEDAKDSVRHYLDSLLDAPPLAVRSGHVTESKRVDRSAVSPPGAEGSGTGSEPHRRHKPAMGHLPRTYQNILKAIKQSERKSRKWVMVQSSGEDDSRSDHDYMDTHTGAEYDEDEVVVDSEIMDIPEELDLQIDDEEPQDTDTDSEDEDITLETRLPADDLGTLDIQELPNHHWIHLPRLVAFLKNRQDPAVALADLGRVMASLSLPVPRLLVPNEPRAPLSDIFLSGDN